ncbi:Chitin deacetylase [Blumeria graminis f. sp. tritici 96224]|uniref:Chitin deacetylase n=1 Tax=Blumeria graminis f. sp. tritici 96224 TaxID=1268274 RepID=A0A656KNG7_BLUGR|nr:Chitin deacetylase [Blumeria graminis f. sp. tritici 96224]
MKLELCFSLIFALLTNAHSGDDHGAPKIVGARQFLSEIKSRSNLLKSTDITTVHRSSVKRQTSDGRCGPGLGSCTNCCSPDGYCGTGPDYCTSPDCQYKYGPQCDANVKPAGSSTANIPRPHIGSVPYGGAGIYDCVTPGTVAVTFDDGPYLYTADVLDKFKRYNAKATFFITGNNLNKGPIDVTPAWSNVIKVTSNIINCCLTNKNKRMVSEGHQVASHTWSHQSLDKVDSETFQNQIIYNEMAFRNILGYFPTYMRPPYSQCAEDNCGSKMSRLGYHVVYFDVDTAGYLNDDASLIQKSKNIWDKAIAGVKPSTDSLLEIEHDIHYQTAYNLTDYILQSMYSKGFKSVTIGECLGDPAANWYRSGNNSRFDAASNQCETSPTPNEPAAPVNNKSVSQDGSCSATVTCQGSTFGNCCSSSGWCGSSTYYCGAGCDSSSGSCDRK